MDDSCAVCAESLEWVAYGPCGHREVCSTCVARLRFICDDRRCCLCKAESQIVFVTKALGDYTRTVTDFSVFPSDSVEGKVGTYWFHEDTQAYFDDSDHYKMIKAMCRLSCSVCDNMEDQGNDGSKKRGNFSNIEQLKSHLYHRHRLFMCSLCLEGRKIFICEQKLYTRSQLNQHINTGDSEVDGSESERGGFTGHPMCEFCRHPFYGDNELYSHMSTEHFTCHICQRQHQGQYHYFKNYDDLEIHFRREHFLCEDEACLAKKFIVFPSESEMKRHNALEHGGNMSRSKRNAVLQIPTSFQYRRRTEQDHRRGRGRGFLRGSSDSQLALAIQDSFEMANTDNTSHGPSSSTQVSGHGEISDLDLVMRPSESLATADSEHSLRYHQALGQSSRNAPLEESFFPPLPKAPGSSQRKHKHEGVTKNTMAARLRHRSNRTVNVHNSPQAWPATRPSSSSSTSSRPTTIGLGSPSSSASSTQSKPVMTNGHLPSSYASFAQARPATVKGLASASSSSPSWNSSIAGRVSYSASAPKLADIGSLDSSMSSFPPFSAAQNHNLQTSSPSIPGGKDVHTANKSLVERIRAALEFDENKFTAFKDISAEFRKGLIDSVEYLSYAQQFGLLHLVPELAKLCPDAWKQKELVETYNTNLRICVLENGQGNSHGHSKHNNGANKGKGKRVDDANSNQKEMLADSFVSAVKKLHLSYKPSEEEVEVLAKDGYRASKGKSKVLVVDDQTELSAARRQLAELEGQNDPQSAGGASSIKILGVGAGGSKPRKKTSKFHRVRLGDASAAARLDLQHSERSPEQVEEMGDENRRPSKGLPVRGVWQNGGGHRLLRQ